jgi:cell volume regulation protein A
LSSVIITTIGLAKSKKIPPPESVEGGFVKPPDESNDDSGEIETISDISIESNVEGGFVKPNDNSKEEKL